MHGGSEAENPFKVRPTVQLFKDISLVGYTAVPYMPTLFVDHEQAVLWSL
jgi:hypothetical protein